MISGPLRIVRGAAAALVLGSLAACALRSPGAIALGTPIGEARQGLASAEYPLPGGGTRLEFPRGTDTYMLDFDAGGRLVATRQVLTAASFATVERGMTESEVLVRLGRPAFVFPVGWQDVRVWNWRFGGLEGDCMVFQIAFATATHSVTETGIGRDPECSRDSAAE